jgi:hypothetical protein
MPVILDPDSYDLWLDPGMKDVSVASDLLKPYDARLMRCYPVGTRINHVANDDEQCSTPVELTQTQARLFQCGLWAQAACHLVFSRAAILHYGLHLS